MQKERPGIMFYIDDLNALDKVDDAEFGRMIRLLRDYVCTGEEQQVDGWMGILYSMMISKMDRDKERYEKICSDRRAAARSRWDRAKQSDAQQCKDEDLQEEPMQTMPTATATATATSTATTTTTTTTTATAASKGDDDGDDMQDFSELDYLIDRYRLYADDHEQVVKENFGALSKQYGDDWLSRAISCAVKEGKVNIAYIRGILRNWYKTGKPDESEFRPKQEPKPFDNPALNYSQRTDSLNDLLMDL
ncbi:MAG: hypothetical protein J6L88_09785 [Clostridia bacterium]|nr:hypothetical protein [Clostridia bacterium]